MNTLSRYFLHRLKGGIPALLVGGAAGVLITQTSIGGDLPKSTEVSTDGFTLLGVACFLYAAAVIYTVYELLPFKSRREGDLLLPKLSPEKLFLCHYLTALLQILLTTVVCFAYAAFRLSLDPAYKLSFLPAAAGLFAAWGVVASVLTAVGFLAGTSLFDSFFLSFLWQFIGALPAAIGARLITVQTLRVRSVGTGAPRTAQILFSILDDPADKTAPTLIEALADYSLLPSSLIETSDYCRTMILRDHALGFAGKTRTESAYFFGGLLPALMIYLVLAAVLLLLIFLFMKKYRPDRMDRPSDSLFGYPLILPYLAVSLSLPENIGFSIAAAVLLLGGWILFRRGFKWKPTDLLIIGGAAAVWLFLRIIL